MCGDQRNEGTTYFFTLTLYKSRIGLIEACTRECCLREAVNTIGRETQHETANTGTGTKAACGKGLGDEGRGVDARSPARSRAGGRGGPHV